MSQTSAPGRAFSPAVMAAMIVVGVFAFAAFFTLSAFAPELTSGRNGRAHALSQSAIGFAGAVRLARARGDAVSIGRAPGDDARYDGLAVLTPEFGVSYEEFAEASGLSTLIILPKWAAAPHPSRRGWVRRLGEYPPEALGALLSDLDDTLTVTRSDDARAPRLATKDGRVLVAGRIEHLQTLGGQGVTPIVTDDRGATVLGLIWREDAPYYILADPDFLNTQGVSDLATARAGLAMLDLARKDGEPIVFDVTLNGLGAARSPLRLAFEPPLLGATLALAIAAALLAWRAAARFGPSVPPRRAIPLGKAALADNSAALIRLAGREHSMGVDYARMIAKRLAEQLRGGSMAPSEAVAWLDATGAAHNLSPSFSALIGEAARATNGAQMLEAARRLSDWQQELKRATR